MKISLKKYAQALYEATVDKSEEEARVCVQNFVKILAENKDLKRGDLIGKYFKKAWNRENGITVVDITTAREADVETEKMLSKYSAKLFTSDKIVIRKKVDKDILGGVIIKNGDTVYDGSLRTRVRDLRDAMTV